MVYWLRFYSLLHCSSRALQPTHRYWRCPPVVENIFTGNGNDWIFCVGHARTQYFFYWCYFHNYMRAVRGIRTFPNRILYRVSVSSPKICCCQSPLLTTTNKLYKNMYLSHTGIRYLRIIHMYHDSRFLEQR